MKKIKQKINSYHIFTIMFIILSFGVFFSFIKTSRSFIWDTDGVKQHYIFFENFYNSLKNIRNGFSTFSWNLGLGLDKIGQLSYYVLGDPFAYLSILSPAKYLKYTYSFLVILRIYFVGISFIAYCNYHKKSRFATTIGALIYTFSGFMLFASVRHPFFANSAIWLPLMFLGIDKILKEDKYKLFTFVSAISAISNYYFFYMITILTFIYAIIKYWAEYKDKGMKLFWKKFAKTFLCYIIGVLTASIILLPTIYAFLNNSRGDNTAFTYYPLNYYAKLIFLSDKTPFWAKVSVCPLALVLLPVSILNYKKNKENKTWLLNLLVYFIILLIPFLGSVMNGFSFQSNRWTFAFAFALSYLTVINLRNSLTYSPREFKLIKNCIIIYLILWFILNPLAGPFPAVTAFFAFIFLIILVSRSLDFKTIKEKMYFQYTTDFEGDKSNLIKARVKKVLLISVCLYTIFFAWETYIPGKYYKDFLKYSKVESTYDTLENHIDHFADAIDYIKQTDNSAYRIATNISSSNNESYKYEYNGLNTYLSIGNKYLFNLSNELLNLSNAKTNSLREFDSRSRITTLLGAKYYVVSNKDVSYVPYGYELIHEINNTQIYINKNYLPIVVFYNNYTLKQDYTPLSPIEKEQALVKTAIIDDESAIKNLSIEKNTNIKDSLTKSRKVNYKIKDPVEIVNQNNKTISPKKKKNYFKLKIKDTDINNCELYLLIKGQKYNLHAEQSITVKYNGMKKTQLIRDKVTSPYYIETPDILYNLGYRDNHNGNIKISFNVKKGTYSYDDFELIAIPIKDYENDFNNLKKYKFDITSFNDEKITGNINNAEDGILQISTSYTALGWNAYVDGKKVDTINVNTGFIGIPLAKGNHKIELVYSTPYLSLGIKLSCIGIILLILVFIIDIIRHKKKGGKNNG